MEKLLTKIYGGGGKIELFKYGSCDKKWYVLLVGAVLIAVVFGSFSI